MRLRLLVAVRKNEAIFRIWLSEREASSCKLSKPSCVTWVGSTSNSDVVCVDTVCIFFCGARFLGAELGFHGLSTECDSRRARFGARCFRLSSGSTFSSLSRAFRFKGGEPRIKLARFTARPCITAASPLRVHAIPIICVCKSVSDF